MTVYVDELFDTTCADKRKWRYKKACHLTADTTDELHVFAARLGMKREWAQYEGTWKFHYDLTESKRALAVKLGAVETMARAEARRRIREKVVENG